MSDDERLLEIATRLMQASCTTNEVVDVEMAWQWSFKAAQRGLSIWHERIGARDALHRAETLMAEWRERIGAREERGQDVSDELLRKAISAARLATELTTNRQTAELFGDLSLELEKIQRASAREASSRDDTPERGQDVSVEMLQRAAVACRSAAAMWSAIPTKSEYWCETADYFDKRARAAGKGE